MSKALTKAQQVEVDLKHAKDLLKEAAGEIGMLKQTNRIQHARLDMFDKCMQLVNIHPPLQNHCSTPDIELTIRKFLQS